MPRRRLEILNCGAFVMVLAMTATVHASRLLVGVLLGFVGAATAQVPAGLAEATEAPPIVLTNLEQLAVLGTDIPADRYQAHFNGVVIYVSASSRRLYVQSGERGIQLNMASSVAGYYPGQRVEVRGTVLGGLPELRLARAHAEVLDEGPLPEPKTVSPHRLAAGAEPYRYLSIRGVIRDMVADADRLHLQVAYEGLVFEAFIQANRPPLPREWLDAEVELRGFSWPVRNNNGRASGFRFHLAGTNFLTIVTPGVTNHFDRPLLTCAQAAELPQQWVQRVRISGTVTVHRPDFGFYLDDGTGVIFVVPTQPLSTSSGSQHLDHEPQTWLKAGERVEVIGLRRNWFSLTPTLIQAEYRRMGQGSVASPRPVSVKDLLDGKYPGELVTLEARLLDQRQWTSLRMSTQSLVLRSGDDIFMARWESEDAARWDLKVDSYVRITGVNDAEGSNARKRSTFQILLRTPDDVIPAQSPPIWTRPEVRRIGLAMGVVAMAAAAFIAFQRIQMRRLECRVTERTSDLRSANTQLQEQVTARERAETDLRRALDVEKELNQLKSSFVSMVSHEFRTPLEVILSSSNILDRYLDRLPPEKRKAQLRAIRASVHRMSDLMEDVLLLGRFEAGRLDCHPILTDLELFCRQLCADVEAGNDAPRIRLTAAPLGEHAAVDRTLLEHVLANLLSNALKYSPAEATVEFVVSRDGLNAKFVITDSGCGIPAPDRPRLFAAFYRGSNVGLTPGTGLGLVIVKRCVECHGGEITFTSAEGQGTTFVVTLPVFAGTAFFKRHLTPNDANTAAIPPSSPPPSVAATDSREDHPHH